MADNIAKSVFNQLYEIDTRGRAVEKDTGKTKLDYLPWAVTYSEVAKLFPDMEYGFVTHTEAVTEQESYTDDKGVTHTTTRTYQHEIPYNVTESGLEVETWVKINGQTKSMRLPVYDSTYKSMKLEPWSYETKYGTKTVAAATMGDIYKNLMRCFAKNLSVWGVGLSYWTHEDAPESVLNVEKLVKKIDEIYVAKKKKGFTDDELLAVCKEVLPDDLGGNYHLCTDEEMLKALQKKLMALLKVADTKKKKEN